MRERTTVVPKGQPQRIELEREDAGSRRVSEREVLQQPASARRSQVAASVTVMHDVAVVAATERIVHHLRLPDEISEAADVGAEQVVVSTHELGVKVSLAVRPYLIVDTHRGGLPRDSAEARLIFGIGETDEDFSRLGALHGRSSPKQRLGLTSSVYYRSRVV
jgi:hypothetical protein